MMKLEDHATPCKGELHLKTLRRGHVIQEWSDHNLVVDTGRIRTAELAGGLSNAYISQIGVGTGNTSESASDTALENQQLFPIQKTTIDGRDLRFDFTINEDQANGLAIREFGLFCADGAMFSHRVRSGIIEKADDIQIIGYWILHF